MDPIGEEALSKLTQTGLRNCIERCRPFVYSYSMTPFQQETFSYRFVQSRSEWRSAEDAIQKDVKRYGFFTYDVEFSTGIVDRPAVILIGTASGLVVAIHVRLYTKDRQDWKARMPGGLIAMLQDPTVLKVGRGIENDGVGPASFATLRSTLDVQDLFTGNQMKWFGRSSPKSGLKWISFQFFGRSYGPRQSVENYVKYFGLTSSQAKEPKFFPPGIDIRSWPHWYRPAVFYRWPSKMGDARESYLMLDAVMPICVIARHLLDVHKAGERKTWREMMREFSQNSLEKPEDPVGIYQDELDFSLSEPEVVPEQISREVLTSMSDAKRQGQIPMEVSTSKSDAKRQGQIPMEVSTSKSDEKRQGQIPTEVSTSEVVAVSTSKVHKERQSKRGSGGTDSRKINPWPMAIGKNC